MRSVVGTQGGYRLRAQLSTGGVGTIHATDRPELVYKEYKDAGKAPQRRHLDTLVSIGRQVIVDQRVPVGDKPESSVNWPLDIVSGPGGTVAGVILPAIPAQLYHEDHGRPRDLQFLILARSNPPPADARVALLLRTAEIFAYIDARKLVHGDVSYRNLVWALRPQPVMYLIDCDGMLPQQPPPQGGVQSLGFADPRVAEGKIPAHDHRSDWYGLALAIYRGLLLRPGNLDKRGGIWPTLSRLPPELDTRIADLLRRALDHPLDADIRPAPAEWVAALQEVYLRTGGAWNREALDALDRVATKPPRPAQSFTPLPPVAGGRPTPSPTPPTQYPPRPSTPPTPTTQPPPTSSWSYTQVSWSYAQGSFTPPPPPPPPSAQPAPPPYVSAPPPYARAHPPTAPPAPPTVKPKDRQPGSMARWAMGHPGSYFWISAAMGCCATPVGLIIHIIMLIDLARTPRYYERRTIALTVAIIYLISTAAVLAWGLFSLVTPLNHQPATDVTPSIDVSPSP